MSRFLDLLLIREDERRTVLYFAALVALLGAGLAFGRSSADALFFKRYGVEHLPTMYALLGLILAATSITFAAYADRLASERLAVVVLAVLAALIGSSWFLIAFTSWRAAYPIYFLVYQAASELLIVHVSLYMAQNFDALQGKRLFPVLFAALEGGRIIGGILLAAATRLIGTGHLLLLWSALLIIGIAMIRRHHRIAGSSPLYRPPPRRRAPVKRAIEQIVQGLRFTQSSALARTQAWALLFLVVSYYILSYAINRIYTDTFIAEADLTAFLGLVAAVTAASAVIMQLLLTGRLLQRFGIKTVNLIFPVTHLLSFGVLLAQFALPAALLASFSRDSVMPALRNPTRNLFFNILPDYMQGRVRALSLGLVLPFGLVASGTGLWLLPQADPSAFLWVGLGAAVALLWCSVLSNRAYRPAILDTLRERLFLPHRRLDNMLEGADRALWQEVARGVDSDDEDVCLAYAQLLAKHFPARAPAVLAARLARASVPLRDRLVRLLDTEKSAGAREVLWRTSDGADDHYRASVMTQLLGARDVRARDAIPSLLASDNPRLVACGILGALRFEINLPGVDALTRWRALLTSDDYKTQLAGLCALRQFPSPSLGDALLPVLDHPNVRVRRAALEVLSAWRDQPWPEAQAAVDRALASNDGFVRAAAVAATHVFAVPARAQRLWCALGDPHEAVLRSALAEWQREPTAASTLAQFLASKGGSMRARDAALRILIERGAPAEVFASLARQGIEEGHVLRRFRVALANGAASSAGDCPARELLAIVLAEREQAALDLALQALEGIEERAAVALIRAGLRHGERHHRAAAIEVLGELRHRVLTAGLSELLQPSEQAIIDEERTKHTPLDDILAWCRQQGDDWLRTCAEQAATARR